jgi:hypothetical protein
MNSIAKPVLVPGITTDPQKLNIVTSLVCEVFWSKPVLGFEAEGVRRRLPEDKLVVPTMKRSLELVRVEVLIVEWFVATIKSLLVLF